MIEKVKFKNEIYYQTRIDSYDDKVEFLLIKESNTQDFDYEKEWDIIILEKDLSGKITHTCTLGSLRAGYSLDFSQDLFEHIGFDTIKHPLSRYKQEYDIALGETYELRDGRRCVVMAFKGDMFVCLVGLDVEIVSKRTLDLMLYK